MKNDFTNLALLEAFKEHPVSNQINNVFITVIKQGEKMVKKHEDLDEIPSIPEDIGLSLESEEFDIGLSLGDEGEETPSIPDTEGYELSSDGDLEISLGDQEISEDSEASDFGDISFPDEPSSGEDINLDNQINSDDLALDEAFNLEGNEVSAEDLLTSSEDDLLSLDGDDSLGISDLDVSDSIDSTPNQSEENSDGLSLSDEVPSEDFDLSDIESIADNSSIDAQTVAHENLEMSEDAMEKLKEIDAILDYDASQVQLQPAKLLDDLKSLDEPLVSQDLNLDSLNFSSEEQNENEVKPEKNKKKKKEQSSEEKNNNDRNIGQELREISGAYSGEMERMQATISNLRADRDELLSKIQKLEEEKVLQARNNLTLRAELDEKKIELTIIRKKLNEEINELKDRARLWDERRLILEEKNKILKQEVDKASQKNKMDMKKIQLRERELEQKLELLKSDAETQIRSRDLKILELKRKIDSMEFDMESISMQEKRSVESRFELEDKLDKAIKTLRSAINVLEDEDNKGSALEALKKNIDM
jgi:hypothetical protein